MSINLTNVAIQQFKDEVLDVAQNMWSQLREATDLRRDVTGNQYKWPRRAQGAAKLRGSLQSDIVPIDFGYTQISVTLQNWIACEYTDIFAQAEVNFDEKRSLQRALMAAISRREGQLIIDALNASATANTIAIGVGNNNAMNMGKLRECVKFRNKIGWTDMGTNHIAIDADGLEQLLGTTQVTSSDFNTVKALVQGDIDQFLGFTFHIIGDGDGEATGLPLSGNNRTFFAWNSVGTGLAIGIDKNVTVDWVAEKRSWLTCIDYKANAVAIDATRIVSGTYDITVDIT